MKPEEFPEIEKLKLRAKFSRLQAAKKLALTDPENPSHRKKIRELSDDFVRHAWDLFKQ
jgi:hypothetical protein